MVVFRKSQNKGQERRKGDGEGAWRREGED